jgi:hypothetical protein
VHYSHRESADAVTQWLKLTVKDAAKKAPAKVAAEAKHDEL